MLDEVAVVAIDAVSSDAVVNGCRAAAGVVVHVTLRVRRNFLGPSRRGTLPVPYRSSNLAVARSTVCPWLVALLLLFTADDDGFWNIGRRGVFTMLAQLSSIVGDSPSREETPSGRGEESWATGEGRKVSALWVGRPNLDVISSVDELSRSATWPRELTPAHVPRSPALDARAGADMRWAALLAALSLARC